MGTMHYILFTDFNIASCNRDLYNTPDKKSKEGTTYGKQTDWIWGLFARTDCHEL